MYIAQAAAQSGRGRSYFIIIMRAFALVASVALAVTASAQTNYTGDILSSYPVITALDISDAPANTVSRYWLYTGTSQGMINYFLPVFVARGTEDSLEEGMTLALSGSIHGDELNGIPVIQRVFASLNETIGEGDFNGTVIGLPTVNPNGNFLNQRNFFTSSSNGFWTNLNRVFPGTSLVDGGALPDSYAYNIWNNLWANGTVADMAIDLHTLSTGSDGPLWAYADYRLDGVQRLAELCEPDVIKIDPGEPGSIETTWVDFGVPAITLEIGPAKRWNDDYIDRAERYIYRLLNDLQMYPNSTVPEIDLSNTYKGTNFSSVSALNTGWVNVTVEKLQEVEEGDEVGIIYNSWGDVIETLTASVSGLVHTVKVDPAIEQGGEVLSIIYNATES
jgi:predicted deacylase